MQPVTHFVRTRLYGTENTQFTDHSGHTDNGITDPPLPTRSGRCENRQCPARFYQESQLCLVWRRDEWRMLFIRFHTLSYGTRQCPAKYTKYLHMTCWMKTRPIHRSQLISPTHHIIHFTYIHTHVDTVVDPSHCQCFWDQSSFSGDTHRSSNRWLPPPPRTSWTRPPLLSSLGSRTWRRARLPNRWKTTSTNSNRLDDTCSSKSSALGSMPNAAYPLRSDPITSTPRSIWERTRLNSGSMNGPRNMPEATNNAFWRTSSWWTLRSSPTPRCTRAATVNNSLCCLCCFPWSNITWTPTILTSTNCFATTAAQKLDRCYTQDDMSHQTNRQQSDRKPWTRTHLAWPWPNVNFEPSQEIEGISHQRGISPHRPNRPYHQTMPSSCTAGTPRHPTGSSYHWCRRHRRIPVFSTRLAKVDPHGVADQASTLPTGTPDTSLHHIQKPAGCYHRVTTEPFQEESRLGPFGPPGIPCHTSRHRSLDLGTTTTTTIGESLHRMGENQFHPHGNRPQQWPLGLHHSPRQHRTLERLPGGGAPEPTLTLHLSKHRVQLCHQSITLDQLDHTNQAGQIPLSQMPHRVSTMGWQRC